MLSNAFISPYFFQFFFCLLTDFCDAVSPTKDINTTSNLGSDVFQKFLLAGSIAWCLTLISLAEDDDVI